MELPDPVTLAGFKVQDVLLVVRLTTPASPLRRVTVIVEVPVVPALTLMLVGLPVTVKSWTTNVTGMEWDREPLVPVTDTCLLPDDVNVHDRLAFPEPATLVGVIVHDEVVFVARLTTLRNPFRPVTVIFEVPAVLTFALTLVRFPVIVKSWTAYVTVTEWESEPLVPVTPTANVPADEKVHESVEVPEPVTLVGETVHEVLLVARVTTAEKPFRAPTVRLEVPIEPARLVTVDGMAVTEKSPELKVTFAL